MIGVRKSENFPRERNAAGKREVRYLDLFVESVQKAAEAFGMTPAFVGFIIVALVGGAAEMASAFSGSESHRGWSHAR